LDDPNVEILREGLASPYPPHHIPMTLLRRPRALYAAFDRFPTRKGASTHIARFAPALFHAYGGGLLAGRM